MQKKNPILSAFDLDHTLIKANCSFLFGQILYKHGQLSLKQLPKLLANYYAHKLHLISLEQLHLQSFQSLFFQKKYGDIINFIPHLLELIPNFLNTSAFSELQKAIEDEHFVVLLSSSPDFIVAPVAQYLKITNWQATRYLVDKDEFFFKIENIMDGNKKAEHLKKIRLERNFTYENTYAFSDSFIDLPFLKQAGNPVAVNPDKRLKKICLQNHWKII